MKIKTIITAALVLGGLLAVGGGLAWWKIREIKAAAAQPPMPEMPETVQILEAKTVSWQPTAQLSGTVIAMQSVVISNEVAGTVKEVLFESGATVEAGQVLVTLDTTTEQADLAAAEAASRVADAAVRTAGADLNWAEANYKRMVQASDAKVAPIADLDKSRTDLEGNKAKVDKAQAELEQARARADQVKTLIAKKTLKAPFKGWVGLRNIHPGQYLKEGTDIVGLQEVSDRIFIDFALPQDQALRVKPGQVVMATSPMLSDEPIRIEVVALDAVADSTTRNVRVRSVVDNKDQKLRPGMFVDISVPVGTASEYTSIPLTAVRRASYGDHVFVINESKPGEMRASQRFVKLGPTMGQNVIVTDGVKAGDRLAAVGSFKLREGVQVMPAPEAPAKAGPAGGPETHEAVPGTTAAPAAEHASAQTSKDKNH